MNNNEFKAQLIRRAFQLSRHVIALVDKFPQKRSSWVITDQLVRAATSIGANIIEAKSSSSKREFIKFYEISLKSANETKFWLALSRELDQKLLSEINTLLKETDEQAKILGSSIATLRGKNKL